MLLPIGMLWGRVRAIPQELMPMFETLPLSKSCRLLDTRRVSRLAGGLASATGLETLVYAQQPPSDLQYAPHS